MVPWVWRTGAGAGPRLDHEGTAPGKSIAEAKAIDMVAGAGLTRDGART